MILWSIGFCWNLLHKEGADSKKTAWLTNCVKSFCVPMATGDEVMRVWCCIVLFCFPADWLLLHNAQASGFSRQSLGLCSVSRTPKPNLTLFLALFVHWLLCSASILLVPEASCQSSCAFTLTVSTGTGFMSFTEKAEFSSCLLKWELGCIFLYLCRFQLIKIQIFVIQVV